jgi:hypothetical protein
MTINTNRLKVLFQARGERGRPASRRGCPSPEKLQAVLSSRLSPRRSTAVIDHLSHCGPCAEEFGFLLAARRSGNALLQDIELWLASREPYASRRPDDRGGPTRPKVERSVRWWFSWRTVPLAAGLLIAGFVISTRWVFRGADAYRAEPATRIGLIRPAARAVTREALVFEWQRVARAERYVLRLFDQALAPVWESGPTPANSVRLPHEVTGRLRAGSYFWMVTATLAGGQEVPSKLEEFTLRE